MYRRDGYRCVYCGQPGTERDLTLDHVEPRLRGGDDSEGNLVTCCSACNTLKGHQPAWSFLAHDAERRAHFLDAVQHANRSDGTAAAIAQPVWPRLIRAIEQAAR